MDTNSIKLVPFETFMESVEATRSEDPFYQEGRLTRFWDNVKNDLGFSKSEDNSYDDWDDEDGETPQKKESIIKRVLAIIKKIVTAIFKFIPTVVKNLRYIEPRHFKGKNANAKVYIVEKPQKLYNRINNHLLAWVNDLNTDTISRRLAKGITRILEGTDDIPIGYGSDADMKTRITALFFPYFSKKESDFSIFCKEVDNAETKDALNGQMLSIMKSKEFSFEVNVSNVCKSINNGIGLEKDIKNNLGDVKPPVVGVTPKCGFTIDGNLVEIGRIPTKEDIQKLLEINSAIPQIFAEYAAKIKKLLEYHNMYITNLSNAINKIDPDVIKSYKEYVI